MSTQPDTTLKAESNQKDQGSKAFVTEYDKDGTLSEEPSVRPSNLNSCEKVESDLSQPTAKTDWNEGSPAGSSRSLSILTRPEKEAGFGSHREIQMGKPNWVKTYVYQSPSAARTPLAPCEESFRLGFIKNDRETTGSMIDPPLKSVSSFQNLGKEFEQSLKKMAEIEADSAPRVESKIEDQVPTAAPTQPPARGAAFTRMLYRAGQTVLKFGRRQWGRLAKKGPSSKPREQQPSIRRRNLNRALLDQIVEWTNLENVRKVSPPVITLYSPHESETEQPSESDPESLFTVPDKNDH